MRVLISSGKGGVLIPLAGDQQDAEVARTLFLARERTPNLDGKHGNRFKTEAVARYGRSHHRQQGSHPHQQKEAAADPTSPGRQTFTRLVLGTADDEFDFDEQGRVVVPQKLRAMANLEKEVILIGCGDRLEIWAKEEYAKFLEYGDSYQQERKEAIREARREMKLG